MNAGNKLFSKTPKNHAPKRTKRYSSKYFKCGYRFHNERGELSLIKAALRVWELKHPEARI